MKKLNTGENRSRSTVLKISMCWELGCSDLDFVAELGS